MKNIKKIGVGKYMVTTPGVSDSEIKLDFNPPIEECNLTGDYLLIHWQSCPKGLIEWGTYKSKDDSYQSVAKLTINLAITKSLQLAVLPAKTLPNDILHVDTDKNTCINQKAIIGQAFLSDVA